MKRMPGNGADPQQELLKQTEELSKIGGWRYDIESKTVVWTEEVYEIHEVDRDFNPSRLDQNMDFYIPRSRVLIQEAFQHCMDTGEPYDLELQFTGAKGTRKWVRTRGQAIRSGNQTTALYGNIMDITERKRVSNALESANARLEALWSITSLETKDFKATCDHILSSIVSMTTSRYGFYGFMDADESTMTIHSWSGEAMHDCSMVDKPSCYQIDQVGVWGEAIRRREPLILNNYPAVHPAKKGIPAGHVPLERILVVPYINHGTIIAVAAVANRDEDYDETDVWQIQAFLSAVQEMLDRRKAEAELRAMVGRQEVLMQELKHRVKNNLNIVSSLLRLELPNIADPTAIKVLADAESRIRSIAMIYERLYLAPSLEGVELGAYIQELSQSIMAIYASNDSRITLRRELATAELSTERAVPLGLILNELITNVLKYAYPGASRGELRITLTNDEGSIRLRVEDDGVGLPAGFSPSTTESMGTQLVMMLSQQIGAQVTYSSPEDSTGTRVRLDFSL